jgi:23S rRNA (uridine2552-2'-O)-methyltransferase
VARYEPHDKFYRKARERGLPSRAAFKIEELLARFRLAREGSRVVDLGCAPGGWLAILSRATGPAGRVVGVDLVACKSPAPWAFTIEGDIRDPALVGAIIGKLGGQADLITLDVAPKLSGIASRDEARSRELLESALEIAQKLLRPGGAMVAKLFMGAGFRETVALFKRHFATVEITRTRATRPGSSELYLAARGFWPAKPEP